MKTIKLALVCGALSILSFAAPFIKSTISWKATEISLGDIKQNKPVKIEFAFTNTGDAPVLITNVQAGCGCTSVDYVKTPVLPGQSSMISAVFNAAAKGAFKKTVTVTSSAEELPRVLTFTGTVIEVTLDETGEKILVQPAPGKSS